MMVAFAKSSIRYFAQPTLASSLAFASTTSLVFCIAYESNILSLSHMYTRTCVVILLVSMWILVIAIGIVWMQKCISTQFIVASLNLMVASKWA